VRVEKNNNAILKPPKQTMAVLFIILASYKPESLDCNYSYLIPKQGEQMMRIYSFFKLFLCLCVCWWGLLCIAARPLPIVLVHGIMADDYDMQPTINYIQKYIPDAFIKNVKLGLGKSTSFINMYIQAAWLAKELQGDPNLKNGCNIIAHSQGGLVARYFIEKYNNPKVHTYISWGTPHQGVFGIPGTLDNRFTWLNLIEAYAHRLLYSPLMQRFISFAGYWHDTLHYDSYLEKCAFLPYLNNEKPHPDTDLFKQNICSLDNMVLVSSENDDIIEPVESCHFGFYKVGSASEIEPLTTSALYLEDRLGLKTLAESGRLHLVFAQCTHMNYQEDEENFVKNTLTYLVPAQ
jgi:palmitoyl-protein thioesterase